MLYRPQLSGVNSKGAKVRLKSFIATLCDRCVFAVNQTLNDTC